MMAATTSGAPKWLLLIIVLVSGGAQAQTNLTDCPAWSFEHFSEKLKVSEECLKRLAALWSDNQAAAILDNLQRMTDVLQKHQKTVCGVAMPGECPFPVVHSKGGLVCVSTEEKLYCKPMCNEYLSVSQGQDFSFLRRSRVYEECSATTKHKWTTQLVGGKKLAVCNKSSVQIAGVPSAYFPTDQDCLKTKSDQALEMVIIETFVQELKENNITGNVTQKCLLCG